MKYQDFQYSGVGCTVIYGGDENDRDRFSAAFLRTHPDFRTEILPALKNYQTGFLRKKKTLREVLAQDVEKAKRTDLLHQLERQGKDLELQNLLFRGPETLSDGQKRMWSMIREAILGKRCFLLRDDGSGRSVLNAARFLCWLQQYTRQPKILWITGLSPETFSDYLFPGLPKDYSCGPFLARDLAYCTVLSRSAVLYELKNGEIQKECGELEPRLLARKEQEAAALLQEGQRLENARQYVQAAEVYELLIQQKNPQAMYRAARVYYSQRSDKWDYSWQLDRAGELCDLAGREFNLPEAFLLQGDRTIENLEKYDHTDKDRAFDILRSSAGAYFAAANRGSAEGCYKAAKLCLRYTLTSTWSDGETEYRLDAENAIPYLKMLRAHEEAGDAQAGAWLLELKLFRPEIFARALEE